MRHAAGALTALCAYPTRAPARPDAQPDRAAIRKLAASISGELITPDMTEYGSARSVFNLAFDRHPALIARCATPSDVARALEFSQTHRLPLAVRGGGHNRAGLSICDDGVVIDLSKMNRVEVDARKRVAHAQAGTLVVHLDAATQRFGLATTSGGCPTVGIAGLTLGGGEGLLMSKYGAACDNLLSAQLILADGTQVEASANSHPDLFWAIRGGGGNFGIATALEYQLHPLTDVLAGTLRYPAGRISDLLGSFARFVSIAPDEMNVVGVVSATGTAAQFQVFLCHCGDSRVGNALLEPLRSLDPREDTVRIAPYLEINATINPAAPAAHFQSNLFLPELDSKAIGTIADATEGAPPGTRVFIVPIYGAVTRVPVSETAFGLRSFGYEVDIMGRWVDTADKTRAIAWVETLRDALRPLAHSVYVNQLGETSGELVRFAYGANYSRLAAVKRKYDPTNAFRSNQNIIPA